MSGGIDFSAFERFVFDFKLATELAHKSKKYDGCLHGEQSADEDDRRFIMSEEEN